MIELTANFALKFLHILGLMLGAAAGFGSMAVARQIRRAGGASPDLAALRPLLGRLGLAGIVLIWLSGLGLWVFRYDMADLGPVYQVKVAVAAVLFGVIVVLGRAGAKAAAAGTPPPRWVPALGMSTPVLTLAAVALAVWVFV